MEKAQIKQILAVAGAGIWVAISEFIRNQILFLGVWQKHYSSIGLAFKTTPINGILWVVWSFIVAYLISKLMKHFSFAQTFMIAWLSGYVMMWIVIYNLQVLPLSILIGAVPLSMLEVLIAEIIIKKVTK